MGNYPKYIDDIWKSAPEPLDNFNQTKHSMVKRIQFFANEGPCSLRREIMAKQKKCIYLMTF